MIRRSCSLLGLLVLCLAALPYAAHALQEDEPTPAPTETPGGEAVEGFDMPGNYVVEVLSGGMRRQFILYVPESYDPETPAPLVFNFHGAGSYASEHMYFSETAEKADEAGFLLVYPDAIASAANWFFWVGDTSGVDEVGFVRDIIRLLDGKLNIDPLRIYAIGYSNGGGMADRLACDLSGEIAAIAQVSGTYPFQVACAPERPVPALTFHGTADTVLAYEGSPGSALSARGWATQWAARNGCASGPSVMFEQDEVTGETWGDCIDDADVLLYSLEGRGHGWPRTEPPERPSAFAPETSVEVNDLIWAFFEAHPMPAEPSEAVYVPEIRMFDREGLVGEKVFAPEPGDYAGTMLSAGRRRVYLMHVPAGYEHGAPTPVVFNFHGRGSSASEMATISKMAVSADQEGYIVVYPNSYGDERQWNFWSWVVPRGPNDVQFVRDMLDELSQAFSIDPARVYATGYSNGGGMADRLACDLSDRIAAAGQVAGTYLPNPGCEPGRPVPVLTLHGTDDTILPYDGTEGGTLSASGWAANWATRNGCTGESSVTFEEGAVTGETWTGCLDGADVVFYTVEGGGHDWFRTEPVPDTTWPTTDIDANAALWAFFEAHPMPENPSEAVPVPEEAVFLPVMGEYSLEIESGGLSRQTVVHIPRGYEDGVPTPLVIAFHGRGDSAVGFAVGSGLINMADEGGFVVAFPQGAGEPTGWDALPVQELTDDVQFTRDLIDALAERLSIDPARVYATGFSAGGRMVNRLGCDLADRIAAISPVGAGAYPSDACAPVRPVPVFAVHGDADTAAPYDGDELDPPVQTWVGDWAMRNGCDAEPVLDARHVMLSAGEVRIGVQTWEGCDRDAAVSLYTYEGLGHVWPSGAGLEAMWAFFEAHPMSPADTGDAGGGD